MKIFSILFNGIDKKLSKKIEKIVENVNSSKKWNLTVIQRIIARNNKKYDKNYVQIGKRLYIQ